MGPIEEACHAMLLWALGLQSPLIVLNLTLHPMATIVKGSGILGLALPVKPESFVTLHYYHLGYSLYLAVEEEEVISHSPHRGRCPVFRHLMKQRMTLTCLHDAPASCFAFADFFGLWVER